MVVVEGVPIRERLRRLTAVMASVAKISEGQLAAVMMARPIHLPIRRRAWRAISMPPAVTTPPAARLSGLKATAFEVMVTRSSLERT